MSLASVPDVVLFKVPPANSESTVLCAAHLRDDSVRLGVWRFSGSMRLSDTASVTFSRHRVPHGRYVLVPDDEALVLDIGLRRGAGFISILPNFYLARLERLHQVWGPAAFDRTVPEASTSCHSFEPMRCACSTTFLQVPTFSPLKKTTSATKLRVSLLAQAAMTSLRGREDSSRADVVGVLPNCSSRTAKRCSVEYAIWTP